jgi:hypothetical protein
MTPMIDFKLIDTETQNRPPFPDLPPGRRIAIVSTVLLVIATTVAWFLFLGWGAVEITHSAFLGVRALWNEFFYG